MNLMPRNAFGPLELVNLPSELNGSVGNNRAVGGRPQISAQNDVDAVKAWLARFVETRTTFDSYRKELSASSSGRSRSWANPFPASVTRICCCTGDFSQIHSPLHAGSWPKAANGPETILPGDRFLGRCLPAVSDKRLSS